MAILYAVNESAAGRLYNFLLHMLSEQCSRELSDNLPSSLNRDRHALLFQRLSLAYKLENRYKNSMKTYETERTK